MSGAICGAGRTAKASPCKSTSTRRALPVRARAAGSGDLYNCAERHPDDAQLMLSASSSDDAAAASTSAAATAATAAPAPRAPVVSRRAALAAAAASPVLLSGALLLASPARPAAARAAADAKAVGSYLPPAPASMGLPEGYVLYAPDARATPSMRAGVIKPPLYSWGLEGEMKEGRLTNALTGDFCFPNCVEPFYEAVFSSAAIGKVFLCCVIIQKLLPSAKEDGGGATVETLGSPENVARAIGPLITGQGYEDEDLVAASTRTAAAPDGTEQKFYDLQILGSTYDPAGPHRLAAVTVRKGLVYIFVGAATDRQWKAGGEEALRAMVGSFRA